MSAAILLPRDQVLAMAAMVNLKGKALQVFLQEALDYADETQSLAGAFWRIGASRLKPGEEKAAYSALRRLAEKLGRQGELAAEGGAQ